MIGRQNSPLTSDLTTKKKVPVEIFTCLRTPHPRNGRRQRVAPVVGHRGSLLSTARPISTAAELLKANDVCVGVRYANRATRFSLRTVRKPQKGKEKRNGDGWRHLQETEGSQLCLKPAGSEAIEQTGSEAI